MNPCLERAEIVLAAVISLPMGRSTKYRNRAFISSHLLMMANLGGSQWESKVMTKLCTFCGDVC